MPKIFSKNVSYAVGTGRCGTHAIQRLLNAEPEIVARHEVNPLNATFHRYCRWYGLPVDDAGFLHTKALEISECRDTHDHYHEASAYLALSIETLAAAFDAKFLFLTRNPIAMVNSYLAKGWYLSEPFLANPKLAPSCQPGMEMHHFLGRIIPTGDEYLSWLKLSRVGKLAWYWRRLNQSVLCQLDRLSVDKWIHVAIEQLDYRKYEEITSFLGYATTLSRAEFQEILNLRPEALVSKPTVNNWSACEKQEFSSQLGSLPLRFGYSSKLFVSA
jgi:hypothetical protein